MAQQKFKYLFMTLTLAALLLACSMETESLGSASCNFVTNSSKQRVSWKHTLPIKFRLHESVPPEAMASIYEAADLWNRMSVKPVIEVVSVGHKGAPSTRDQIPVIYWMHEWEDDRFLEQARTTVRWLQDQLVDADIKVNAKNFSFFYHNQERQLGAVDFVGLMVHEFGHALGFAHNSVQESVMFYQLRRGQERRKANNGLVFHETDIASYQCEYGEDMVLSFYVDAIKTGDSGIVSGASNP
ncbi:MAG: matrixin family metalloprotease [Bdellovibrionaceae bacterium]|nr:matrixin family metalloprotease [Pseudobdellovibrionaceae bacterium]